MSSNIVQSPIDNQMEKVRKLMELEKAKKEIEASIKTYRAELLAMMQDLDIYSLKTGSYTISRATKTTPHVTNFNELKRSLDAENIPYVTEEVFAEQMKKVFSELAKKKKALDGLEYTQTEYTSIRIAGEEVKHEQ